MWPARFCFSRSLRSRSMCWSAMAAWYRWADLTNGDNGVSISTRPAPFGISLADASSFYYATLLVLLLAFATMAAFVSSPFGASLRGTRDQPRRMTALGYNVWLIRFLAFLFSGFWCAIAGLLYL